MPHLEALVLGLDVVLDHPLPEGPHGGHGVVEDLVAEVTGAAVQGGHLREQLRGLQSFLGLHARGPAGGGDHDDVGKLCADGVHDHPEPLPVLGGGAVVPADVDVDDGSPGVVGGPGLPDHLRHSVGDGYVLLLGDLCAAYSGGDDELLHIS